MRRKDIDVFRYTGQSPVNLLRLPAKRLSTSSAFHARTTLKPSNRVSATKMALKPPSKS